MKILWWQWPDNHSIVYKWYKGQYPRGSSSYCIKWRNIFINRWKKPDSS